MGCASPFSLSCVPLNFDFRNLNGFWFAIFLLILPCMFYSTIESGSKMLDSPKQPYAKNKVHNSHFFPFTITVSWQLCHNAHPNSLLFHLPRNYHSSSISPFEHIDVFLWYVLWPLCDRRFVDN